MLQNYHLLGSFEIVQILRVKLAGLSTLMSDKVPSYRSRLCML